MISKSDLIILVLASSALAVGIFRWHQNTQDVNAITIPASSRIVVEPGRANNLPVIKNDEAANASLQSPETNTVVQSAVQAETRTVSPTEPVVEVVLGTTENTAKSIELGRYQVQSGDTLGKIANQYGTDVQTLRDLNNISGSIIQIGQEIFYPL